MKKLIELSIRGSRYYLFADLNEEKMEALRQLAACFYSRNSSCWEASDDAVAQFFFETAKKKIDLNSDIIDVHSVLVIK